MNTPQPSKNIFKTLKCKLFGHKFEILRSYKTDQKEYQCAHCKNQFTQNEHGDLQVLTPKLRRINEVMEKFYMFRHQRQTA